MAQRTITTYDPTADAAERWPSWRFVVTELGDEHEIFVLSKKLVLCDRKVRDKDPERFDAHVVAHLDLHWKQLVRDTITLAEEKQANDLADMRLDREHIRPQPSIPCPRECS